ncbi:MAG: hypothetical protein EBX37_12165 [Alphaproteobacteria bacterium]|nr:hypothetical protein [Alphaproteobacteria bacterium]
MDSSLTLYVMIGLVYLQTNQVYTMMYGRYVMKTYHLIGKLKPDTLIIGAVIKSIKQLNRQVLGFGLFKVRLVVLRCIVPI